MWINILVSSKKGRNCQKICLDECTILLHISNIKYTTNYYNYQLIKKKQKTPILNIQHIVECATQ